MLGLISIPSSLGRRTTDGCGNLEPVSFFVVSAAKSRWVELSNVTYDLWDGSHSDKDQPGCSGVLVPALVRGKTHHET